MSRANRPMALSFLKNKCNFGESAGYTHLLTVSIVKTIVLLMDHLNAVACFNSSVGESGYT